jgi:anti-sigma regulatory factor (Ser/Thr protein kinase)
MRARGMPLGLMPDMEYEVKETRILPGDNMILYSDGLVEAHNAEGQMFGTPRLQQMLQTPECGKGLIECLMDELTSFTGPGWEQEDDVTFVIVDRLDEFDEPVEALESAGRSNAYSAPEEESEIETMIAKFSLPSQPGNEREAMERVAAAVDGLDLPKNRVDRLKTAVSEATMNAMEHGNKYQPENPVEVEVKTKGGDLVVSICDCGGDKLIAESPEPDLAAKLEGVQSPRGWGLFLIKNMVDDMHVSSDGKHHVVELVLHLEGEQE